MPGLEQQDFARYEFKYLLKSSERAVIEEEISHFMDYDGHVSAELDNQYVVRSLYFDDASASNYYEKIDGIKTRLKYRIRTYARSSDSDAPVFLEVKGRHNEHTYKHRVKLRHEDLEVMADPTRHNELLSQYADVPLVASFVFDSMRKRLLPSVLVDYHRRPYNSPFDMNFRLTFDSSLSAMSTGELFPPDIQPSYLAAAGWTVLEVKFNRRIPAWYHRILQAHGMRRLSFSKFCKGMEVCGLAVDLS